jgi:SynChlorMet cassette protein ScmD
MTTTQPPIANPLVVLRPEFDDWAVLFNPDTAEAVGVNPVGVVIWQLIDGRRGVEEIVATVRERFADAPPSVVEQVGTFIEDLARRGFVGYELLEKGQ